MRLHGTAQVRAMSNSMKEINSFLVDEQLHGKYYNRTRYRVLIESWIVKNRL